MVSVKDANAMAEVIYYLKGIRQEDVDKIPKKFIQFLNENASKEYICNFDYKKPLKELNILDETRGIIGMICYNYWWVTEQQKELYLKRLSQNEQQYQEILHEKYNPDNLFKNCKQESVEERQHIANEVAMVEYKESVFKRFINKIKGIFHLG